LFAPIAGPWEATILAGNLAELALIDGDLSEAELRITESLSNAQAIDNPAMIGWCLTLGALLALKRGTLADASTEIRDALEITRDAYDIEGGQIILAAAAALAAASATPLLAAKLWAAADTAMAAHLITDTKVMARLREEWLPVARDSVDPQTWQAAWDAGAKLGLEQALELAAGTG
jgi:hypothetical protein